MNVSQWLTDVDTTVTAAGREFLLTHADEGTPEEVVMCQLESGGKRLRPAMVIAANGLCGGREESAVTVAAGLELLHNYTLIIDDVIDGSDTRRGQPTAWRQFGSSIAQSASFYYAAALNRAVAQSSDPVRIGELFADTLATVTDGQMQDIALEQSGRAGEPFVAEHRITPPDRGAYFAMIERKTAALFSACCRAGAITAGADREVEKQLSEFGHRFGCLFQLRDDIDDIASGQDITERKGGNILVVLALEKLQEQGRGEDLIGILRSETQEEDAVARARSLIAETNTHDTARAIAARYEAEARDILESFSDHGQWGSVLAEFLDYVSIQE